MLPQALKLKVIQQYEAGKLQKDMAQNLGISTGSVSTILKASKDKQIEGNSIPQEQPKQPSVVAQDTVLKPEYSDLQIISQPQPQEIQQQPLVSSQQHDVHGPLQPEPDSLQEASSNNSKFTDDSVIHMTSPPSFNINGDGQSVISSSSFLPSIPSCSEQANKTSSVTYGEPFSYLGMDKDDDSNTDFTNHAKQAFSIDMASLKSQ
jgi:hypothetical protein